MIFHDDFSRVTHCVPPILRKEIAITECEPNIAEPCPPNCFTLPPISAGVRWRSYRWMNGCKYGKKNWQFRQSIFTSLLLCLFFSVFSRCKVSKMHHYFFFGWGRKVHVVCYIYSEIHWCSSICPRKSSWNPSHDSLLRVSETCHSMPESRAARNQNCEAVLIRAAMHAKWKIAFETGTRGAQGWANVVGFFCFWILSENLFCQHFICSKMLGSGDCLRCFKCAEDTGQEQLVTSQEDDMKWQVSTCPVFSW